MANKWFISDTHWNHARILMFTKPEDQTPIRPGYRDQEGNLVPFKDIQHHDEVLVERWNARVRPEDKVYHVGDFGNLDVVTRLNGKKRLILGNHDDRMDKYQMVKHFEKIYVSRHFRKELCVPILVTHYPVHKDERYPAPRFVNVHGHIHEKVIKDINGHPDRWYLNVAVEQINYEPISWDELNDMLKKRFPKGWETP